MGSDIWCVIRDMGDFDVIYEESTDKKICEMYIEIHQIYHDNPLEIKLKTDVRKWPENSPKGINQP